MTLAALYNLLALQYMRLAFVCSCTQECYKLIHAFACRHTVAYARWQPQAAWPLLRQVRFRFARAFCPTHDQQKQRLKHGLQADGGAALARVAADAQVPHQLVQARCIRQVQVPHLGSRVKRECMRAASEYGGALQGLKTGIEGAPDSSPAVPLAYCKGAAGLRARRTEITP